MHCCDFRAWNLVLVGQLSAGIFPFVLMFTEKRRELRQFVKTRTRRSTITVLLVKTKLQGEEKRVTLISLPSSPGRSLGPGLMEVKEEVWVLIVRITLEYAETLESLTHNLTLRLRRNNNLKISRDNLRYK